MIDKVINHAILIIFFQNENSKKNQITKGLMVNKKIREVEEKDNFFFFLGEKKGRGGGRVTVSIDYTIQCCQWMKNRDSC